MSEIITPRLVMEERFKDTPVLICGGCNKRSDNPKYKNDIWNFYDTFTSKWMDLGHTHEGHKVVTGVLECNDCGWYDGGETDEDNK